MKFKIMPIYIIEADNPHEVIETFMSARKAGTVDDYFETYIVKRMDEKPSKGWFAQALGQVTGN